MTEPRAAPVGVTAGRLSVKSSRRMTDAAFIGIEIGGTKLQLVAGGAAARVGRRVRLNVDPAAGGGGICRQIGAALVQLRGEVGGRVAAIGVGFGGPVDWQTGRIR